MVQCLRGFQAEQLTEWHPALRTVFVDSVCKGGVFDQIVLRHPDSGVFQDTCADSQLKPRLESIKYISLNGKKKPQLPHQFSIIQTTSSKVYIKMEINHAVIDGGSLAIVRHDLKLVYEGQLSETERPLYSDYYIKYIRNLPCDGAIQYWKDWLKGLQKCHFPISPQHSSKRRQPHSLYMDFDRFQGLQVLAERNNVTLSNIMLSAWALGLRIYVGSSDICFGYLTSDRNVPFENIGNAVGAFINMLISRVQLSRNQALLGALQKVQSEFVDSLPHQHCSMAQFQHELGLSGESFYNTAISVQNHGAIEGHHTRDSSAELEHLEAHDPSEFAITVNVDTTRGDEGVRFSYWTHMVSDDVAKNVSSTMAKFLTQMADDVDRTIAEVDSAITDKSHEELRYIPRASFTMSGGSFSSNPPPATPRSYRATPRFEVPNPMASIAPMPRFDVPVAADWGTLIRNIVNEVVPQILDQMLAKNKNAPHPTASTISEITNQMAGMLSRKASQSLRPRADLETGSNRSRRMSVACDAESRINIAADMVAAAGVVATETLKSVPPNFVEKKLLILWSELLELVEDAIDTDDSFSVSPCITKNEVKGKL